MPKITLSVNSWGWLIGTWCSVSGVFSVSGDDLKIVNLIGLNPFVFFCFIDISQHTLKRSSLFDAIQIVQVNQKAPTLRYWSTAALAWDGLASLFCQRS